MGAPAPIALAVEHLGAPVIPSNEEASYVIQGMEVKLRLAVLLDDDTLRLINIFSPLVSPAACQSLDMASLSHILGDIQREIRPDKAIKDALEDASGCTLPPEVLTRDIEVYHAQGSSLVAMVRVSLDAHKQDRFNQECCNTTFSTDIEYERLLALATTVVVIDIPDGLTRGHARDPPRRLTNRLYKVYTKAAYEGWRKGQGVIVPRERIT